METINLGAVLFVALLLVWLCYAVPRIAERRDLMGRAGVADQLRDLGTARDLTAAGLPRRLPLEVSAMPESRVLSRPADPTRRPRFEEPARLSPAHVERDESSRRVLRIALLGVAAATVVTTLLALSHVIGWGVPVVALAALVAFVVVLRRAELARRERARHETSARRRGLNAARSLPIDDHRLRAPAATVAEPAAVTATPAPVARPGEWMPRPVPRPAYSLRGDVDDLHTRHVAHRASVLQTSMPYELEDLEEQEAERDELEQMPAAVDLGLDEILARRRGA